MKLRVVGAAVGATLPTALAAVLLLIDPLFALVALVGAFVGAGLGFVFARYLARAPEGQVELREVLVALAGVGGGLIVWSAYDSISRGVGWFPTALLVYSGAAILFGMVPALVISLAGTWVLRRVAAGAERWWMAAAIVVTIDAVVCLAMLSPIRHGLIALD